MEVVEDESIATSRTAASKRFGKSRVEPYKTVETTLSSSSMLSVETHPPSARSSNTFDSRQDSPNTELQDSDAMMTSTDATMGLTLPSSGERLQTTTITTRVVTGGSITNTPITNLSSIGLFGQEEKVSLAPRFGKLETNSRDDLDQAQEGQELGNPSMFSLSGSMSSEFIESQQLSDDHQQEYLHHPSGMSSPTSTTARDFLREVQGPPPLPRAESMSRSFGSPTLPLHQRPTGQRPPFHPPSSSGATSSLPSSPNFLKMPSLTHKAHPTLPREHTPNNASSPSPTSFNCDRDKPVISRCFAWSHDSQDDRRITKRPRMAPSSSLSSPHSTGTGDVMSPSSALDTIRDMSPPRASSPTKVHWEEKVEHSNELMTHASVDPQVLFAVTSSIAIASSGNEDVAMGDTEEEVNTSQQVEESRMPPPISMAQSASHYSFDSL